MRSSCIDGNSVGGTDTHASASESQLCPTSGSPTFPVTISWRRQPRCRRPFLSTKRLCLSPAASEASRRCASLKSRFSRYGTHESAPSGRDESMCRPRASARRRSSASTSPNGSADCGSGMDPSDQSERQVAARQARSRVSSCDKIMDRSSEGIVRSSVGSVCSTSIDPGTSEATAGGWKRARIALVMTSAACSSLRFAGAWDSVSTARRAASEAALSSVMISRSGLSERHAPPVFRLQDSPCSILLISYISSSIPTWIQGQRTAPIVGNLPSSLTLTDHLAHPQETPRTTCTDY